MDGFKDGTKVHVKRGQQSFHGVIVGRKTEVRKRKTRRDTWDMVEVIASYEVELEVVGLSGTTTTRASVPPGSVRRF